MTETIMKRPDATTAMTKTTPADRFSASHQPSAQKSLHVGVDWLNTTWRMAVPVVIAAILGIVADQRLDTGPWLTLLGAVAGFVVAGLLVARLLKDAENEGEA